MILATTLLTNATMDVHLRIFVPIAIITDGPARPPPLPSVGPLRYNRPFYDRIRPL